MNLITYDNIIINNSEYQDYDNIGFIYDRIDLDEDKSLILFSNPQKIENQNFDNIKDNSLNNISIPIASAITALGRIHMSLFFNNPLFKLFYTDTDCIFVDKDLSKIFFNFIGNGLGQLKLENIFKDIVFVAPKTYAGINEENIIVSRSKGLKQNLNPEQLRNILIKNNSIEFVQEKMFQNLEQASLKFSDQIYTLKITENKRKLIYDNNNILVNTKPFKIFFDKIIEN